MKDFVFFTELCTMTPDISCRSLIQIGLEIPRWQTKWRTCKDIAVSQAFILHFKWYSILQFAVCQLSGFIWLAIYCYILQTVLWLLQNWQFSLFALIVLSRNVTVCYILCDMVQLNLFSSNVHFNFHVFKSGIPL